MTREWLTAAIEATAQGRFVVRAVVIATSGSTPRDTGADMLVHRDRIAGSIGGGALEHDVITHARAMLDTEPDALWLRAVVPYHLGPALAQCCGGALRVLLERIGPAERATLQHLVRAGYGRLARPLQSGQPMSDGADDVDVDSGGLRIGADGVETFVEALNGEATPLVIYGAGHVGRAVVRALADLPFAITWVEITPERFPEVQDGAVSHIVTADPDIIATQSPGYALHLVMTHSHALDEAIVAAILRRGRFGYLGLIGSATKRARFNQRLARFGIPADRLARLTCPIGLPGLAGKEPAIIAASVAADLLLRRRSNP